MLASGRVKWVSEYIDKGKVKWVKCINEWREWDRKVVSVLIEWRSQVGEWSWSEVA